MEVSKSVWEGKKTSGKVQVETALANTWLIDEEEHTARWS